MVSDFSAGKIVGDSFQILVKRFVTIFTIAFICGIPSNAIAVRDVMREQDEPEEMTLEDIRQAQRRSFQEDAPFYLLTFIMAPLTSGALAFAVYQHLRGKHASVADCIGVALRRFFPLLGVAVCSGLFIGLGAVLLIIPGIIFATMVYVASPACVVEKEGVFASMQRSRDLTSGYRWRIFVVMLGVNLLVLVAWFVVRLGAMAGTAPWPVIAGCDVFLQTIQMAWNGSAAALAYYHLRSIKDSVDVEDVAAVFD
jgi:hypothetical protein